MKLVIAENVKNLMHVHGDDANKAAARTGMKLTQIKRVLTAKHYIRMDTLQRFAVAYDVEPYQLLVPGLNAKNPQTLRSLSPAEENLYRALEEARKPGTH